VSEGYCLFLSHPPQWHLKKFFSNLSQAFIYNSYASHLYFYRRITNEDFCAFWLIICSWFCPTDWTSLFHCSHKSLVVQSQIASDMAKSPAEKVYHRKWSSTNKLGLQYKSVAHTCLYINFVNSITGQISIKYIHFMLRWKWCTCQSGSFGIVHKEKCVFENE